MTLVPIRPPGRSSRKARTYAPEIAQLRAQGYTFEAIREALAAAGVHVSNSTVQREAARPARVQASAVLAAVAEPRHPPRLVSPPPASAASPAPQRRVPAPDGRLTGREIAEAFMRDRITNPLIRAREPTR